MQTERQLFDDEMNPTMWIDQQNEWRQMRTPGEMWGINTTIFAFHKSLVISTGPNPGYMPQTRIVKRHGQSR